METMKQVNLVSFYRMSIFGCLEVNYSELFFHATEITTNENGKVIFFYGMCLVCGTLIKRFGNDATGWETKVGE